ncbi:MAG: flagellin lysine-N-methylase [Niameybacter sp.]|uniref:flagellin lysine-N-methylase n=1 Tax=Niameybacter sp. TaxID=2033640 RepID=UPI002FCABD6B
MTKQIKIDYYDAFRCIADKCDFSCCQEWRIAVDDETRNQWKGLKLQATQDAQSEQPALTLYDCLEKEEDGHIITLNANKKCPFLNAQKLCRLVLELGEDCLSETCTKFPRRINIFEDRTEYALDFACPAVIDLIYSKVEGAKLLQEGMGKGDRSLLFAVREMMLVVMEDDTYSLPERMMIIFYVLLDLLDAKQLTKEKVKRYEDKAHLKPLVEAMGKMKFNAAYSLWERNELFLDVVHNYRKQKLYVEYLEPIAVRAERLEEAYLEVTIGEKVLAFEQVFEAYHKLVKDYVIAEIFGSSLLPEMTLTDMVIAFEWITMEYATMKQAIFLSWLEDGEKELEYKTVRHAMMIISRVTGYDQEDIKEYLENSFESTLWEWGYLALVVGNGRI